MDLGDYDIALDVKDIERTADFYLAMGFEKIGDGSAEIGVVAMRRGDCRICLYGKGHLDPARTQLIFWDGDVPAICERLKAQGVTMFRDIKIDDEGGSAFMILDPDDNPIFFIVMKTHFKHDPKFATPARPRPGPMTIDPVLGWFEFALDVKDIARSEAFYRKLGFEPVNANSTGTQLSMQCGECRIGLFMGHLQPPGQPQLIFWQGDVEAVARKTEGEGPVWNIAPRHDASNGHRSAGLFDPDGVFLYFINIPGMERRGLAA